MSNKETKMSNKEKDFWLFFYGLVGLIALIGAFLVLISQCIWANHYYGGSLVDPEEQAQVDEWKGWGFILFSIAFILAIMPLCAIGGCTF